MINYRHTQELFDKFRDNYFSPKMCAGYNWHKKVVDEYDKVFVTPYLHSAVKEYFYLFNWEELNKPVQKHHIRNAFPELLNFGKIRNHTNLHLGAGIDKLFETLLDNKKINFNGRKRMMDVSRDWYKKENTKPTNVLFTAFHFVINFIRGHQ